MSAKLSPSVVEIRKQRLTVRSIHQDVIRCTFDESAKSRFFTYNLTTGDLVRLETCVNGRVCGHEAQLQDFETNDQDVEIEDERGKALGSDTVFYSGEGLGGSREIDTSSLFAEASLMRYVQEGDKDWRGSPVPGDLINRFTNHQLDAKLLIQDLNKMYPNALTWSEVIGTRRHGNGIIFLNGWNAEQVIQSLL